MQLWHSLRRWWPGKILVGAHGLAVTVKSIAALATAVLTTNATAETSSAATDTGSVGIRAASWASSRPAGPSSGISNLTLQAVDVGLTMVIVIQREGISPSNRQITAPLVHELVASGNILLLTAAVLGSWVSWLWREKQQQGIPEPYHEQLLLKLSCSGLVIPAKLATSETLLAVVSGMHLLLEAALNVQQQQQFDISRQESQAAAAASPAAAAAVGVEHRDVCDRALPADELVLMLFELLALQPPSRELLLLVQAIVHPARQYAAGGSNSSSNSSNFGYRLLLKPLLFYMGPALSQLMQTAKQQQEQETSTGSAAGTSATAGAAAAVVAPSFTSLCQERFSKLVLAAMAPGEPCSSVISDTHTQYA